MSLQTSVSKSASGLTVLHVRPGACAFGHLGPLALQVWLSPAEEQDGIELGKIADRLHAQYPDAISTIHLLRHGTGMPTSGAREHLSRALKTYGNWFGEVVVVMDGKGFWAGAIRSMLTGLRMAAGGRGHLRVAASMQEVATWLPAIHKQRTGVSIAGSQIITAMDELVEAGH